MGDGRLRDLVAYWGWTVFSFTKWNFFVLTNAFLDLKKRNPLVLTTATEARTEKSKSFKLAKQQFCTCIKFFCTFRCCHYKAVTWKCLISPFREGHEHRTTTFFFFSWTLIQLFWIQLQKTRWNKGDKAVWSSANALFKWRFCSRRFRFCLSSLIPLNNAQTTFARQLVASCQIWFKNPVGKRGEDLWASTS